jgi:hypothetical protein
MNIRIRAVVRAIVVLAMAAVSPAAFCATVTWDAGGGVEGGVVGDLAGPGHGLGRGPAVVDGARVQQLARLATVNGAWSGVTIDVAGGSVALNTSGTIPTLTLSAGTLAGSGGLTVTGPSTWSGGTIGGSGALTFDTGATVTMPGTRAATLNRPLLNQGTINFAAVSS